MAYARVKKTNADAIPVIDITPLRDGTNPMDVAKALHGASRKLGFIYIAGHGIPEAIIASAQASALAASGCHWCSLSIRIRIR